MRSSAGAGELAARAPRDGAAPGRLRAEERGDGGVLRAQRLGLADRRAVRQEPLHDVRLAPFRRAVDAALARRVLLVEQRVPPRGLQHGPDGLQRLEPPEATRLVDDGPPHVVHGRLHKHGWTHFIQRLTDDLGAVAHLQLRPDRRGGATPDGSLRRRTDEVAGVLGPRVLPGRPASAVPRCIVGIWGITGPPTVGIWGRCAAPGVWSRGIIGGACAGTATEMIWPGMTPAGIGTSIVRPSGILAWTCMPGYALGGTWTCTVCCCCGCIGATLRTSREFSVFTFTWRMPVDDTIFCERAFWPNRTWKGKPCSWTIAFFRLPADSKKRTSPRRRGSSGCCGCRSTRSA